ncbi:hypothetical protein Bxe_B1349 [Paraburkholderia xenovorans LB400]|uniref:Uncharacterized protein n=1 Tax=Paraburkholderia xenovorans (strain LB400) TaxID=266265 RepID=Q13MS5_PARXL|nr:hypothetical protein Bxe_B1349 [Paraburkholderia xenovorans LB400]
MHGRKHLRRIILTGIVEPFCNAARERSSDVRDDADGATAPETLRQKDRAAGTSGERRIGTACAPTEGDSPHTARIGPAAAEKKLSGTWTDGASAPVSTRNRHR